MTKEKKRNIHLYFSKEVNILYHLVSIFFIIGYGLDLTFNFRTLPHGLIISDFFALLIILIAYGLGISKRITRTVSSGIIIYSSTIILIASYLYLITINQFSIKVILQDFVTIPPLIFAMGFIVNKRNMIALGVLFMIFYPSLMLLSNSEQLKNSALFVGVMIFGFTLAMLILIRSIESTIDENEKINKEIKNKNKELDALNKERVKLLSVIAHDLRNPIGGALNIGSFLLEENHSREEQKELIVLMTQQNKKAYELLENLLNWAKNEQGFLGLKQEETNLHEIANNAMEIFAENINAKNLKIINNIPPNLKIKSDKILLETIFRNLLSNAIKFSYESSEIIIGSRENKNSITFFVKDYGMGIKKELLESLFSNEPITSTKGTLEEKGTGIGLKLTKDLVEKNKGKIWVESKLAEGATFYVTLPR